MVKGGKWCKECGTLLNGLQCPNCKKEHKQVLLLNIYLSAGVKHAIRGISRARINSFVDFMNGTNSNGLSVYVMDRPLLGDEVDLFIPRQSVSYFEVREVVE